MNQKFKIQQLNLYDISRSFLYVLLYVCIVNLRVNSSHLVVNPDESFQNFRLFQQLRNKEEFLYFLNDLRVIVESYYIHLD